MNGRKVLVYGSLAAVGAYLLFKKRPSVIIQYRITEASENGQTGKLEFKLTIPGITQVEGFGLVGTDGNETHTYGNYTFDIVGSSNPDNWPLSVTVTNNKTGAVLISLGILAVPGLIAKGWQTITDIS